LLAKSTIYAFRALGYLARQTGNDPIQASVIARNAGVPLPFLSKVLKTLNRAGLIAASKGPNGGHRLTRAPEKITLLEIFMALDDPAVLNSCVFGWRRCSDKQPCPLHDRWTVVRQTLENFLRWTTLATMKYPLGDELFPLRDPSTMSDEEIRQALRDGLLDPNTLDYEDDEELDEEHSHETV
jgi:Rrf2 family protein